MNQLFDLCVLILQNMAIALGMTYQEINIWIFVILEPVVFLLMCFWIWHLKDKIRKLKVKTQL